MLKSSSLFFPFLLKKQDLPPWSTWGVVRGRKEAIAVLSSVKDHASLVRAGLRSSVTFLPRKPHGKNGIDKIERLRFVLELENLLGSSCRTLAEICPSFSHLADLVPGVLFFLKSLLAFYFFYPILMQIFFNPRTFILEFLFLFLAEQSNSVFLCVVLSACSSMTLLCFSITVFYGFFSCGCTYSRCPRSKDFLLPVTFYYTVFACSSSL